MSTLGVDQIYLKCFRVFRLGNMGCFSCFPRQETNGNMNCFSCFKTQGSIDGKKRNMNCFSCFQMREGKTRKMNCFPCFPTRDLKQEKKELSNGKIPKLNGFMCFRAQDSTQVKPRKMTCFSCFQTQDSTLGKTRNMNCFSCFQTTYSKQAKKAKKRNKKWFSCFPKKGKTRNMKRVSCFPINGKKRCKWLRKGKGMKRICVPSIPFKKKRVSAETQDHDVVFHKRARNDAKKNKTNIKNHPNNNVAAKNFTFKELAIATKNFKEECLLGEGGFGRVYKGELELTGQIVAVKQLNRDGKQGNKEFLVEVMILSHLCHQNLVNLVGYCADGEQRLLVYEYMASGSLENHLLDLPPGKQPIDWSTRMKVAMHAAQGLEYLHETNNPPVIYRDLKSSNILLDQDFNAKLSDFGLAKLGPVGDKTHVTSRVMGTLGYCAPEYQKTGKLTVKSDIYSYGVVLLELITGRRAVDLTRKSEELHLVRWAAPRIKDPHKYSDLVDPLLQGNYPRTDLSQVLAIAAMCLSMDATVRPSISDVVAAFSTLT